MAMTFGLSTHLFHGDRLGRAHLETIKAHGFDAIELFATRTHVDYHDPKYLDGLAKDLAATGVKATSMHAPICESYVGGVWGRAYSNAATEAARRLEAVKETTVALGAAKRLGCELVVLHLGQPVTQEIPPGDNDRGAVNKSLDALAEASAAAGVPLALEVLPNRLSDSRRAARVLRGPRAGERRRLPRLRSCAPARGRARGGGDALGPHHHDARPRQPRHTRQSPGAGRGFDRLAKHAHGDVEDRLPGPSGVRGRRPGRHRGRAQAHGWRSRPSSGDTGRIVRAASRSRRVD